MTLLRNVVTHKITVAWQVNIPHKTIVVEASDIAPLRDRRPLWSQLYDDACDVGCCLFNPTSHKTTWWYMSEELKRDGDLEVTIFKPTVEELRVNPTLAGWELHILND